MTVPRTHGPRERMVFAAAQLIRRDGVGATGMRDVAARAEAPRGSLQHYFPGGKEQLVNEAVTWAGRYAGKRIDRYLAALPEPTPGALFAAMTRQWIEEFESTGFATGCPVAAATVDSTASTPSAREATATAFASWSTPLTAALTTLNVPPTRAPALATLMISTLEGAILLARAQESTTPLTTVTTELAPLLNASTTP
ncbi:TetR/AcrR family transcriptional regulator [Actinacidiphila bryophytorum]|uniref:TetR/AcrR family transcriptional regulator n=1 Tax=Actinacidiphila bryophytorum TaxID=1436133 RepID=UPI002176C298|nr:TetR/AcrR family transcriptional regulator [Actinacidiphila bryophytorum]UWE13383.1 TetR/AcrR family transcriptional regulator [Actinacidiphila bryophytorum]